MPALQVQISTGIRNGPLFTPVTLGPISAISRFGILQTLGGGFKYVGHYWASHYISGNPHLPPMEGATTRRAVSGFNSRSHLLLTTLYAVQLAKYPGKNRSIRMQHSNVYRIGQAHLEWG